jgi:hypothetical protein
MERVCRPVVSDSRHFDGEQDLHPDPNLSKKSYLVDPH